MLFGLYHIINFFNILFASKIGLILGLTLYCIDIQAQRRSCNSDSLHFHFLRTDPEYRAKRINLEYQTKKYNSNLQFRSNKILIPVVVHVLYNLDAENIADSIIHSQIEALNRDFGKLLNTRYKSASTSKIVFALATSDPSGIKTNGITRTKTINKNFQTGATIMNNNQGGKDAWPVEYYMNLWVGNISGVLGYAYMPGTMHDGVVINYKYFGMHNKPPFHLGRTVTHEVGHWLNLFHTWGLSTGCEADDEVEDTPNSAEPNFGCKQDHESCGGMDMVENFMDYSDDACMNLFTQGQVNRMESLFAPGGFRHSMLSSPGLDVGIQDPCFNLIKDNGESGVDCGGSCLPCPSCNDQIKNGNETDTDCGGDCRPCGCLSKGEYSMMDFVDSIKINGSVSRTGDNGGYYFNHKLIFTLYSNASNFIELVPGTTENAGRHIWNIWVDWNRDGRYSSEMERIYSKTFIGHCSDSIFLPDSPYKEWINDTFSIRIQMKWGDHISSGCDTFDFGEVEDYKVVFIKKYIDPCTNGIRDESEQGIDCGPYCTPCAVTYCVSSGKDSRYEYIKKITWNGIPYSTGNNNGYRDFTGSIITISGTKTIHYQLEAGFAGNYTLTEYWMIYADWNKDGDFDEDDEKMLKASSSVPLSGSFVIPENSKGKIRIRVIMTDAANTKSCGYFSYGEAEDYMIEIEEVQPKKTTDPGNNNGYKVFPIPADQFFYITSASGEVMKEVIIRNFLGQVVQRASGLNDILKLDCSNLSAGNYLVTIYDEKKQSYQSKITIAH